MRCKEVAFMNVQRRLHHQKVSLLSATLQGPRLLQAVCGTVSHNKKWHSQTVLILPSFITWYLSAHQCGFTCPFLIHVTTANYSQLTRRAIPWTRRSGQTLGLGSSCGLWFHIWVSCQEGGRPWQRGRSVQSTNQLGVGRNIQSPEIDHNIHEKITHLDKWLPFIVKTFYKVSARRKTKK